MCMYIHTCIYIYYIHILYLICLDSPGYVITGKMDCFGRNLSNQGVVETSKTGHLFEFVQVRSFGFQ